MGSPWLLVPWPGFPFHGTGTQPPGTQMCVSFHPQFLSPSVVSLCAVWERAFIQWLRSAAFSVQHKVFTDHIACSGFLKILLHRYCISLLYQLKKWFYNATYPATEVILLLGRHRSLLSRLSYIFHFHFYKNMYILWACHMSELSEGTKTIRLQGCCFGV